MLREIWIKKKVRKEIKVLFFFIVFVLYKCVLYRMGFGFKNEKVFFFVNKFGFGQRYIKQIYILLFDKMFIDNFSSVEEFIDIFFFFRKIILDLWKKIEYKK